MSLWSSILAEARDHSALRVLASIGLSFIALRFFARNHLRRIRSAAITGGIFLVLLLITGYLRRQPSQVLQDLRLAADALGLIATVWAIATVTFAVLETRVRLQVPRILADLVVASVTVVAISVMLSRKGFNLSSLFATSAVLTAVIGLSLQDTLGNMVAGVTLQVDSSIQVGDWIKLGDLSGRVSEIRWRYTAIETRNWETVLIPNAQLVKGQVIIQGRRQNEPIKWRRWLWFNVDFRYSPEQVVETVVKALRSEKSPNVADTPEPQCLLMEMGESYYRFAVRYWLLNPGVDDPTDSAVRTRVITALKRAGIPLSLPAEAVFLTADTAERRHEKLRVDIERRTTWLRRIELFNPLSEAEIEKLAQSLQPVPFSAGEVLTRQGAEAHWLYVIASGTVSVRVRHDELEREVARLGPGQYFGEMGLLTGEPRTATVVAVEAVECFRLDKQSFQALISERPEIVDGVAHELAARRAGLLAARDDLDAAAHRESEAQSALDMLRRMRTFFGLAGMSGRPPRTP